jgi:hypothetical protein
MRLAGAFVEFAKLATGGAGLSHFALDGSAFVLAGGGFCADGAAMLGVECRCRRTFKSLKLGEQWLGRCGRCGLWCGSWSWSWCGGFGIWCGGRCGAAGGAEVGGGGTGDGFDAAGGGNRSLGSFETRQQRPRFAEAIGQLCTGSAKGADRIDWNLRRLELRSGIRRRPRGECFQLSQDGLPVNGALMWIGHDLGVVNNL